MHLDKLRRASLQVASREDNNSGAKADGHQQGRKHNLGADVDGQRQNAIGKKGADPCTLWSRPASAAVTAGPFPPPPSSSFTKSQLSVANQFLNPRLRPKEVNGWPMDAHEVQGDGAHDLSPPTGNLSVDAAGGRPGIAPVS